MNFNPVKVWKKAICWEFDTQWVCGYKNCVARLLNLTAILKYLKSEINQQANKDVAQAIGNE